MTSERKQRANRRNSTRSTGPRTEAGKSRSAANSLKHGFSARPVFDAATQEKILAFAELLIPATKTPPNTEQRAIALEASEAHFMIQRIRQARVLTWNEMALHPAISKRGNMYGALHPAHTASYDDLLLEGVRGLLKLAPYQFDAPFEGEHDRNAEILKLSVKQLSKFNRYEREWTVRRDKSLQKLSTMQ